jgi:hypothetical protein
MNAYNRIEDTKVTVTNFPGENYAFAECSCGNTVKFAPDTHDIGVCPACSAQWDLGAAEVTNG